MPRTALDLNNAEDLQKVSGVWRRAAGLVPGEPNQGLVAEMQGIDARLKDYDDSSWDVCDNIRESISTGFTFAWYRLKFTIPTEVNGEKRGGPAPPL